MHGVHGVTGNASLRRGIYHDATIHLHRLCVPLREVVHHLITTSDQVMTYFGLGGHMSCGECNSVLVLRTNT